MSLVSLVVNCVGVLNMQTEIGDILDNIESSEKNELCVVVETYPLDVRFKHFDDLFPVLQYGSNLCLYQV